jgi:hypothetical protein
MRIRLTWPRLLTAFVWLLTISLVLLMLLLGAEIFVASNGEACSIRLSADCYPWGDHGQIETSWSMASRQNYLIVLASNLLVCVAALVGGFFVRPAMRLLLIVTAFAVAAISKPIL